MYLIKDLKYVILSLYENLNIEVYKVFIYQLYAE